MSIDSKIASVTNLPYKEPQRQRKGLNQFRNSSQQQSREKRTADARKVSNNDLLAHCLAPGTCGELVQGYLNGQDFLVNCPIDLFSRADVYESVSPGVYLEDPVGFSKISAAANILTEQYGIELAHDIHISSSIPRGKGMASSTADISAALQSICDSVLLHLSPYEFAKILTLVEPSDCVHFQGIAYINHLTGTYVESLPAPTDMRVLVVDCGGEVDTVRFDREHARSVYRKNQARIAMALNLVRTGLQQNDNRRVARGATISAQLSQQILYKPQLDELLVSAMAQGALGVNCAHSGTVLGILYEPGKVQWDLLQDDLERRFGDDLAIIGDHQVISGGCHAAY